MKKCKGLGIVLGLLHVAGQRMLAWKRGDERDGKIGVEALRGTWE